MFSYSSTQREEWLKKMTSDQARRVREMEESSWKIASLHSSGYVLMYHPHKREFRRIPRDSK